MIRTVNISHLSSPDYVAQAIEGTYGLDGRENIYFTCIKNMVFVSAAGPLKFDEMLPQNSLPWHLTIFSNGGTRTVKVDNSHLSFTLNEGETAQGMFRIKA